MWFCISNNMEWGSWGYLMMKLYFPDFFLLTQDSIPHTVKFTHLFWRLWNQSSCNITEHCSFRAQLFHKKEILQKRSCRGQSLYHLDSVKWGINLGNSLANMMSRDPGVMVRQRCPIRVCDKCYTGQRKHHPLPQIYCAAPPNDQHWLCHTVIHRLNLLFSPWSNFRSNLQILPCHLCISWPALLAVQASWRTNNMDK